MRWLRVSATDPFARALADRHYPRENVGAKFFTPPGRKVVLRTQCGRAFWVSLFQLPEYTDHAWPGAWQCSAFRNDNSGYLSSDLIRDALAATVAEWGQAPREGMITFVDGAATSSRRSAHHAPGHCFRVVGFADTELRTTRGYHVLRLAPADFPLPRPVFGLQTTLDLRGAA